MHRGKKKRNIIIISLVGIMLCMIAAYAAISNNLQIEGTSEITSSWDIKITNVTAGQATGDAENAKIPEWEDTWASVEANLYSKGDAMEYDVTILNNGSLDAKLEDIITNTQNANSEAIIITFTGYKKGEVLEAHTSKNVHIKIEYNPDYNGEETSSEVEINFDFVQDNKDPEQPQTYMLTYDYETNGGTRVDSEGEFLEAGTTVDLSNKAYKNGWKFVGWNTNKDAHTPLTTFEMVESNVTLYAIFKKDSKQITLTFNENGSTINNKTVSCTIPEVYNNEVQDTSCQVTSPAITPKEGFTVLGYETNANATEASWKQNTQREVSNNATYYAITKSINPYTATFNANGATISKESESCYRYNGKESCDITTPAIQREGFNIIGWGEEATSTTAIVNANATLSLTKTATYYAVTNKEINVTYQKGINVESIGAESGKCTIQNNNTTCQITLPSITPKEGYISVGWNTVSGATTGSPAGNNVTLSNNTTYYANAIDNIAPEVTFNPNTQSTFIAGGKAVTVKISDAASGLKANQQISYAWSTSNTTAPTFSNTVTTSNQAGDKSVEVTIPETSSANLTGSYYLWIKSGISDTLNNVSTNKISEVFKFDNEDPTLTISTTSSSTTIIVVANATAASGISKYEYSKDGGKTWEDGGTNNTYRFTGLTPSTTYNIMARITNGVGKQATAAATQYIDITENPVTSGDGLYEDPTTEDRYIYKGAKPNNYVNFNNELWRIIAQEPDNTLKIIRVTPLSSRAFDNSNNRSSTYCNSSSNGCNAWGNNETTYDKNGSKVTAISDTYSSNTTYALPTKEASLNTYLNGDYYNSLTETARNQIDTHMFNVGNVSASTSNTINTDMLEEEKYKWLGKIGLLNLTDYVKASSNKNCTKVASYSSTAQCSDNSQSHNWITVDIDANHPRFINGNSGTRINVWGINSSSYKIGSAGKANVSYGVKPVLYLKSNVKVISGEGTQTNPYELGEGVSTTDSDKATFTEEGLYPKTVTIHFPDGCGDNLTCSYKQDNGQSINVTTQTVELEYTQNGTIVANVSNGVNTETSSYTVEIKLRAVDLSYDKNKTNLNCAEIQCALEAIDKRR